MYPNCALIVAGDFDRLDATSLKRHFNLHQIIKKATRKDAILDLVLTNVNKYYKEPRIFAPFGLYDHNTIVVEGQLRNRGCSICASCKAELGSYLAVLEWEKLFSSIDVKN